VLSFTSSNTTNTYIKSKDESITYRVTTTGKSPNEVLSIYRRTHSRADDISHGSNEAVVSNYKEIASVEWKYPDGYDILRLGDATAFPQKLDKWLKRGTLNVGGQISTRTFTARNNVQYKWTQTDKGYGYKLVSKNEPNSPLAVTGVPDGRHTRIAIEQRAIDILDEIIISFVMIVNEKRLVEEVFLGKAQDAYDMSGVKLLSWGRSRSKSKSYVPLSGDSDSVYAASTANLLPR